MHIYDPAKFKNIKPVHAEGHICIDLTDPLTGKVKERIKGQNHVFTESLFSGNRFDWVRSVSGVWLCLNDSTAAIDSSIPYLLGQTVGYGIPSMASSGLYRGAYNIANQVLAQMTLSSARWKFQYDFTTAQANGVAIGTIGLTSQYSVGSYDTANQKQHLSGFMTFDNANKSFTCDGRYTYICSTAGIITKYDLWLGTSSEINVSAIVGTVSGTTKTVGYAPATGLYYIYCYSGTASSRKMYVFTDASFGTLSNTYSPTNLARSGTDPMYVYGTVAYWMASSSNNTVHYADFSANVAYSTLTVVEYNNAAYLEDIETKSGIFCNGTCGIGPHHVICNSDSPAYQKGIIFDLSLGEVAGYLCGIGGGGTTYAKAVCLHPLTEEKIVCSTANGNLIHRAAIAAYKLPSTLTKTSANGMTATYELEVFW